MLLVLSGVVAAGCGDEEPTAIGAASGVRMPAGCGNEGGAGPLVMVVAGHANVPTPEVTTAMASALSRAVAEGSPVGVVGIDGDPRLVQAGKFEPGAHNEAAAGQERSQFVTNVGAVVQRIGARAAHADYLRGLSVAADAVHASCPQGGEVILQGSGLQDTGVLNFARDEFLSADPQRAVRFLQEHNQLPDLHGITVVLVGIGETRAPQQQLDQASRDNLVDIWVQISRAAGAAEVKLDTSPRSGEAPLNAPEVSTVAVPAPVSFPVGCSVRNFRLPDTGPVGFLENVAIFRDPAAARAVIAQIATAAQTCPGARIALVGATSSYGELTPAGDRTRQVLALRRAEAVKALLVGAGVAADRIDVSGNGYHFDGYVADRDAQGELLSGPAQQNRCVLVSVSR
ncbi:hypothetical protein QX204_34280 (plasmid) [Nocardia sp. PE-7]|uniref:OmpA family protein n=1 Tax=Nocardia sp. PE-7 TaxID=3058426 RepID=UPI00265AE014|nr:OmpA family protein [Nocardia sp. PE-7]WKG13555.1 hypothetical protein QX204_34280 [Nocardia sp. PE-7]